MSDDILQPQTKALKHALENILPFRVFHLHCNFTTPPKNKFLLLAGHAPEIIFFVINSKINQFIKKNSHLHQCQVLLTAKDHSFLQHDSYLNCSECVNKYDLDYLKDKLQNDDKCQLKGQIHLATRELIIAAVQGAKTIAPKHKREIMQSMEAFKDHIIG